METGWQSNTTKQARLRQLSRARVQRTQASYIRSQRLPTRSGQVAPQRTPNTAPVKNQSTRLVLDVSTMQQARAQYVTLALFGTMLMYRMLGVARNLMFGSFYGNGSLVPSFTRIQFVPDSIFNLVTCCVLTSILFPLVGRLVGSERMGKSTQHPAYTILHLALGILLVLACVLLFFTSQLEAFPHFDQTASQAALATVLMRLTLFQAVIMGINLIAGSLYQSRYHGLKPAIGAFLCMLCSILGLLAGAICLWLRKDTGFAIQCTTWGLVVGAALQLGIQIPMLVHAGLLSLRAGSQGRTRSNLPGRTLLVHSLNVTAFYLAISLGRNFFLLALIVIGEQILQFSYFASYSATLQLLLVPAGLLCLTAVVVAFPALLEYISAGRVGAVLFSPLRKICFLALPLACIPGLFISLHMSDGHALSVWSGGSAQASQLPVAFLLLGFAVQGIVEMLIRVLWRGPTTRHLVSVGILFLLLKVVTGIFLLHLAVQGLLWGVLTFGVLFALTATFEAGFLLWLLYQRLKPLHVCQFVDFIGRLLLATAAMGMGYLAAALLLDQITVHLALTGPVGGVLIAGKILLELIVSIILYLRIAALLQIAEAGFVGHLYRKWIHV